MSVSTHATVPHRRPAPAYRATGTHPSFCPQPLPPLLPPPPSAAAAAGIDLRLTRRAIQLRHLLPLYLPPSSVKTPSLPHYLLHLHPSLPPFLPPSALPWARRSAHHPRSPPSRRCSPLLLLNRPGEPPARRIARESTLPTPSCRPHLSPSPPPLHGAATCNIPLSPYYGLFMSFSLVPLCSDAKPPSCAYDQRPSSPAPPSSPPCVRPPLDSSFPFFRCVSPRCASRPFWHRHPPPTPQSYGKAHPFLPRPPPSSSPSKSSSAAPSPPSLPSPPSSSSPSSTAPRPPLSPPHRHRASENATAPAPSATCSATPCPPSPSPPSTRPHPPLPTAPTHACTTARRTARRRAAQSASDLSRIRPLALTT